jgi:hypothetical protein
VAHGSFYMYGAYFVATLFAAPNGGPLFWAGLIVAPLMVAAIGAGCEVLLLRRVYARDHLVQLLVTYAMFLIFADLALRFKVALVLVEARHIAKEFAEHHRILCTHGARRRNGHRVVAKVRPSPMTTDHQRDPPHAALWRSLARLPIRARGCLSRFRSYPTLCDAKLEIEGRNEKAAGKVENAVGGVKDALKK